jgi:hypothetical protein
MTTEEILTLIGLAKKHIEYIINDCIRTIIAEQYGISVWVEAGDKPLQIIATARSIYVYDLHSIEVPISNIPWHEVLTAFARGKVYEDGELTEPAMPVGGGGSKS